MTGKKSAKGPQWQGRPGSATAKKRPSGKPKGKLKKVGAPTKQPAGKRDSFGRLPGDTDHEFR